MELGGLHQRVDIDLSKKVEILQDYVAELLNSDDFYMISKFKPLNPKFSLIDIGIVQEDIIHVV